MPFVSRISVRGFIHKCAVRHLEFGVLLCRPDANASGAACQMQVQTMMNQNRKRTCFSWTTFRHTCW